VSFGYALYFVERTKNRVVRWDPDRGDVRIVAGAADPGDASQLLQEPYGLAFDAVGNLLISDKLNHRICRLRNGRLEALPMTDRDGHRNIRRDSPRGYIPNQLHSPTSLAIEKDGAVLCSFYDDKTIYRIHPDGRLELLLGIVPNRPYFHDLPKQSVPVEDVRSHPLGSPTSLVARSDGTLFFVERQTQVVREFHEKRGFRGVFAISAMSEWFHKTEAPETGMLDSYHPVSPVSLALDQDETLYLCDNLHGCILKLNVEKGTFNRVLFVRRKPRSLPDVGPIGVAFGPDGTPWVVNTEGQEIRAHSISEDGMWVPASASLGRIEGEELQLSSGGLGVIAGP